MTNPTFNVFKGSKEICTVELQPLAGGTVEDTNTVCFVQVKLAVSEDAQEIQEFCYLYCVTPSFHGRTMPPNFELNDEEWGYTDFNHIEYMFSNFPKAWRVRVQGKPKSVALLPLPDGAIP